MKKIVILISLFILLVVWFAPIQLVESFLPENRNFAMSGLQGSVWSGKIDTLEADKWHLQQLDYSISFLSLLTGNIGGSSEIVKGDIKGDLSFEISSEQEMSVSDANLQVLAQRFERYLPIPGIELGGKISSNDFSAHVVNKKPISVSGITQWDSASVNVKGNEFDLGKLSISWQTDSETGIITGTVEKTNNTLSLTGKMTLDKKGMFEFKGSIAQTIDKMMYNTFLFFADGKAKDGRLPIKFKKKIL